MYNAVSITRTLAVVPYSESWKMAEALVRARPITDHDLNGPARVVARLLWLHQHDTRYARFPLYDSWHSRVPDVYGALASMFAFAGALDGDLVFDFWQFDYGDVVHGHVSVSRAHAGTRYIPAFPSVESSMVGISTRPLPSMTRRNRHLGQCEVPVDDTRELRFLFGDDIESTPNYINQHDVFDKCTLTHVSGPALTDQVWDLYPKAPGTDFAYDAALSGTSTLTATSTLTR